MQSQTVDETKSSNNSKVEIKIYVYYIKYMFITLQFLKFFNFFFLQS